MKNAFKFLTILTLVVSMIFVGCPGEEDPTPQPKTDKPTTTPSAVAPNITTQNLPNGVLNTPYASTTLSASGTTPITWSLKAGSSLPTGLSLSAQGVISGTPTVSGGLNFHIVATNSAGTHEKEFSINITATASQKTVTFVLNGGNISGSEDNVIRTVENGEAATAPTNPTKTGYTFAGWDKTFTNVTTDLTVTAQWTAITYSISYNSNGGSGATMDNSLHTYDVAKNLSSNTYTPPTDKQFGGWNTAANGSGTGYTNTQSVKNLSSTQGANITVYAQWQAVSSDQDFYYGVTSATALNYIRGTNTAALAKNAWENSIATPAANTNAYLDKINASYSVALPKTVSFSGNNLWFILLPKSLGNAIIMDAGGQNVTAANPKDSATFNGVEYWLHSTTSSGPQNGLTLKIAY